MSLDRPKGREGLTHQLADDGVIAVYDRVGRRLLVLDAVGSGVWSLADGTRTRDEIVDEMVEFFSAPRDRVREDVDRFLATLAEHDLLDVE